MNSHDLLGLNVRKLRVAKGISQEGLAAEAKIDRAYLGKIERGKTRKGDSANPSLKVLERIAKKLGVGIAGLFQPVSSGDKRPLELKKGRKPAKRSRKRA